jgi:hypothetical protein
VTFALKQVLSHLEEERAVQEGRYSRSMKRTDKQDSVNNLTKHYVCGTLDENVFAYVIVWMSAIIIIICTFRHNSAVTVQDNAPADVVMQANEIDAYFRTELIDKRNIRIADRVFIFINFA